MTIALRCDGLVAGYQGMAVVRSLDFHIDEGEIVCLLGPNGAGKTTVLSTIAGLLPRISGTVELLGDDVSNANATALTRRGLVLVPDDRALFTTLTARENIELGRGSRPIGLDEVLDWFPPLGSRLDVRAGLLSGGEQQMLALARALVQQPRVLLVDELSMGLAPVLVEGLLPVLGRLARDHNVAVVLVEQHVRLALGVADRTVVLVHGEVALDAPAAEIALDLSRLERAYMSGSELVSPGPPRDPVNGTRDPAPAGHESANHLNSQHDNQEEISRNG